MCLTPRLFTFINEIHICLRIRWVDHHVALRSIAQVFFQKLIRKWRHAFQFFHTFFISYSTIKIIHTWERNHQYFLKMLRAFGLKSFTVSYTSKPAFSFLSSSISTIFFVFFPVFNYLTDAPLSLGYHKNDSALSGQT